MLGILYSPLVALIQPITVILKFDGYYHALNDLPRGIATEYFWSFFTFRCFLSVINVFELLRALSVFITVSNVLQDCFQVAANYVAKGKLGMSVSYRAYSMICLVVTYVAPYFDPLLLIGLAAVEINGIFGWYLVLTLHSAEQAHIFLYGLLCGGSSLLLFQLQLVPAAEVESISRFWRHDLKSKPLTLAAYKAFGVPDFRRRFIARKIRALRVFCYCAGINGYRLFKVRRNTKRIFLEQMISLTVTAILSIK